ncbi:hypothetical protein CFB50_15380 [Burkholderia sp. AU33423]|uniref:MbcA/ParS/Xre antitoxin family protein n=1 Tax=Burkholderia sp. AU33423 TaxID=2015355 RepID=UPI000B7AF00F|nr:MbcA/ParS/Xre antitoxin family protein [Burkholderia sp. AU33423]OXI86005.1 hypothetical protein CFB50_15380 [Burkholderia sp. AU33423]
MAESDDKNPLPLAGKDEIPSAVVEMLAAQIQRIVEESGNPAEFDARSWLEDWLRTPVPALNWRPPMEYLDTPGDIDLVSRILASAQSGTYW